MRLNEIKKKEKKTKIFKNIMHTAQSFQDDCVRFVSKKLNNAIE